MLRRALIVAATLANVASAKETNTGRFDNEFLANLLGRLYRQGESFACFSRQYDDAHLAAHGGQRVTFVRALVDAYFRESSLAPASGSYLYQVSLAFRFRDRPETLTGVAECGDGTPSDSLHGGAYCAGPAGAATHLALQGRQVLVVTIPDGADLWMPGPVDKRHDTVKNPFGPDDRVFRLIRTDLRQCEDLAFNRQKPLRPHGY
jgi:hypothetical protein